MHTQRKATVAVTRGKFLSVKQKTNGDISRLWCFTVWWGKGGREVTKQICGEPKKKTCVLSFSERVNGAQFASVQTLITVRLSH